jgi:predicted ATPase
MKFLLGNNLRGPVLSPAVVLIRDNWNDWFKWQTMYSVKAFLDDRSHVDLGSVKIGRRNMAPPSGATELPNEFEQLNDDFFSLGQSENYYETLNTLPNYFRQQYLESIRDCAYNIDIFENNLTEPVMRGSLLREISISQVRGRFRTLAQGRSELTKYSFEYEFPKDKRSPDPPPILKFDVEPLSLPPTNVHVLIGRNGVGKSRCFDLLARTLLGIKKEGEDEHTGNIYSLDTHVKSAYDPSNNDLGFTGLVSISFSAFDTSGPLIPAEQSPLRYAYVGLKRIPKITGTNKGTSNTAIRREESSLESKTHDDLIDEFVNSVEACRQGVRQSRWRKALETLETDPLFKDADVSSLAADNNETWKQSAKKLFKNLSSGHGIVLLTITRLIELVEERSLVLLDEPEGHLHPPLLSAFVRALSDLLTNRNGVAIVATHSPVVLQEVPNSCIWILSRSGRSARADRPEIETFGENVGILTREVFGLEVVQSGFHRMVSDTVAKNSNYEEVINEYSGQLGSEARSLARALIISSRQPGTHEKAKK